jgi:hypothetical protein
MNIPSSASFGKRQEFVAIAELLRRNFDVYLTLVDDKQIDCVIRKETTAHPIYLDIQIKARSKNCVPKDAGTFAAMDIREPRPNFFFIFYSEQADTYWIVPSLELVEEASRVKSGKGEGRYRIVFTNLSRKTGAITPRPRFRKYEEKFNLLWEYGGK